MSYTVQYLRIRHVSNCNNSLAMMDSQLAPRGDTSLVRDVSTSQITISTT